MSEPAPGGHHAPGIPPTAPPAAPPGAPPAVAPGRAQSRAQARRAARPRLLSATFWATALDDAVRHGATWALAGFGGDAVGVVRVEQLVQVAELAAVGFGVSLLATLATRAAPRRRD